MEENKHPIVTITMVSGADIVMELYPENAPNACRSFLHLIRRGLYDGQAIRRVVPGFVIQPSYSAFENPEMDYEIAGEFSAAGFPGGLKNETGCVAMAGNGLDRASGSEFFITLADDQRLDGRFTVIGRVVSGWGEVKRIERVATKPVPCDVPDVIINEPVVPEIMQKVSAETFGADCPPPLRRAPSATG
ncbi:MAG: peptidylprolyl isomerase [Clostridiales bacterium]|nr:peptidylprolyl isomerase [Clostridiales bacterium]